MSTTNDPRTNDLDGREHSGIGESQNQRKGSTLVTKKGSPTNTPNALSGIVCPQCTGGNISTSLTPSFIRSKKVSGCPYSLGPSFRTRGSGRKNWRCDTPRTNPPATLGHFRHHVYHHPILRSRPRSTLPVVSPLYLRLRLGGLCLRPWVDPLTDDHLARVGVVRQGLRGVALGVPVRPGASDTSPVVDETRFQEVHRVCRNFVVVLGRPSLRSNDPGSDHDCMGVWYVGVETETP